MKIEIKELEKISLNENEILLITVKTNDLTVKQCQDLLNQIKMNFDRVLSRKFPVIAVSDRIDVKVITKDESEKL